MKSGSPARPLCPMSPALSGLLAALLLAASPSPGRCEDAAAHFSAAQNPYLNWRYGWASSPGGTFVLDATVQTSAQGLTRWLGLNGAALGRHCNGTNLYLPGITLPGTYQPGAGGIVAWPGSGGEAAVLRWTAPAAGTYRVNAAFTGLGGYPSWPDLNALDGAVYDGQFGRAVAGPGDVNGDGFDDVIVGQPGYSNGQSYEGRGVVYFGGWNGLYGGTWSYESDLTGAVLGQAVAGGDLNGDSYADVALGAPGYSVSRVLVFYGSASGLPAAASATLTGSAYFGESVCTGDFNGDGVDDLAVGSPDADQVLYWLGSSGGLQGGGTTIQGAQAGSRFGHAIAGSGDVDGDGFDDLVVSASTYYGSYANGGKVFLFRGSPGGLLAASAWQPEGDKIGAFFGVSVAHAGDVNGDSFGDILVGAMNHDSYPDFARGRAWLYLGSATGPSTTAAWTRVGEQQNGQLGASVAGAGDVDRNGYHDIVIGEPEYQNGQTYTGRALIFRGTASGIDTIPSPAYEDIQGNAGLGDAVACAGDVNGDGNDDVVIGAPRYDSPTANVGRAVVLLKFSGATAPKTTADVAVYRGGGALASGQINLGGAGNEARSSFEVALQAGEALDFTLDAGGNGSAFDAVSLSAVVLPAPDPVGPAGPLFVLNGERFLAARGGPAFDNVAFDPVNRRYASQGKIRDLCGAEISNGPDGSFGLSWDPVGQHYWSLEFDQDADAWTILRFAPNGTFLDTLLSLPRILTVPGTGADTLESPRGLAVDLDHFYIVDAGPQNLVPPANAWFKFTRDGTPVMGREGANFSVNATGDIVDDIVYSPLGCPTAPGRLLVCIEHRGIHVADTDANLLEAFLWSQQSIASNERPQAFAGLTLDPTTGNLFLVDNDAGALQVWERLADPGPTSWVIGMGGSDARLLRPTIGCDMPLWKPVAAALPCNAAYQLLFGATWRPADQRVYSVDYESGDLWKLDPRSGRGVRVGPTGYAAVWGVAYDAERDVLYGFQQAAPQERILQISPMDATAAPLPQLAGYYVNDLAFDPLTQAIYGVASLQDGPRLIRFNRDTGAGSIVGPTPDVSGLDHDPVSGFLLGVRGCCSDTLWRIDPVAGGAQVHAILPSASGSTGLAVVSVGAVPVAVQDLGRRPANRLVLYTAPNPARDIVTMRFELPAAGPVSLRVFDVAGREVQRIEPGVLLAGPHALRWDGRSRRGERARAGLYFIRLESMGATAVARVVTLE